MKVVIISGLSGSGKTAAIKAVEDLGFFCIDNLPLIFLEKFILLSENNPEIDQIGIVIDIRSKPFLDNFSDTIRSLKKRNIALQIIFLTCDKKTIIKRYSETRRVHPLHQGGNIEEEIEREEKFLAPIRELADNIIDTTNMTVHELRSVIHSILKNKSKALFSLKFESFGFKYGVPIDIDYIFDVRCLPNPYFVDILRDKTGKDSEVQKFLESKKLVNEYLHYITNFLKFSVPLHEKEGKLELKVGVGCTGGKHRSVFVAEKLFEFFTDQKFNCIIFHRDIKK